MKDIICYRKGKKINLSDIKKGDDLTGLKIGRILVVAPMGRDLKRTRWKIECSCGVKQDRLGAAIRKGRHQSCGGKRCKHLEKDRLTVLLNMVIHTYRKSARNNRRTFDLSRDEVQKLVLGDCRYCGAKPVPMQGFATTPSVKPHPSNGIDRVNNELGYTMTNCVSCCGMCNKLKRELSENDFFAHIQLIVGRAKTIRLALSLNAHGRRLFIANLK